MARRRRSKRSKRPLNLYGLLRPRALADAWTRQLRYRDETQRLCHVRRILPVAQIFVRLVRAEMVWESG